MLQTLFLTVLELKVEEKPTAAVEALVALPKEEQLEVELLPKVEQLELELLLLLLPVVELLPGVQRQVVAEPPVVVVVVLLPLALVERLEVLMLPLLVVTLVVAAAAL